MWIAGTPSTPTANSATRVVRGLDRVAGRDLAEQQRVDAPGVGDHEPPGAAAAALAEPSRSPASTVRMPRPPASTRSASSAHTGTPVSTSAISSASLDQVAGDGTARGAAAPPRPPRSGSG